MGLAVRAQYSLRHIAVYNETSMEGYEEAHELPDKAEGKVKRFTFILGIVTVL